MKSLKWIDGREFDDAFLSRVMASDAGGLLHHLVAVWDRRSRQWARVGEGVEVGVRTGVEDLRIVPSGVWTSERALRLVLARLAGSGDIWRLLVALLVREYRYSYMVEIVPLAILLACRTCFSGAHCANGGGVRHEDAEDAKRLAMTVFRSKRSILHAVLETKVRATINSLITNSWSMAITDIVARLAAAMAANHQFQVSYGSRGLVMMSGTHCKVGDEMFSWNEIWSAVTESNEKSGEWRVRLVMNDLFSDRTVSIRAPKGQREAEEAVFLLTNQLELLALSRCSSDRDSRCRRQIWELRRILSSHQDPSLGLSLQLLPENFLQSTDLSPGPSGDSRRLSFLGESFQIEFVPLSIDNRLHCEHLCVKTLQSSSKFQEFWQLWMRIINWRHSHILQCYGLVRSRCAFFREVSNGPLIFSLYNNGIDFLYQDVLDVLLGIGSALDYLHNCLNESHGNVNLKSIVKVGNKYKISEPSLTEDNSAVMKHIEQFNQNLEAENKKNSFVEDVVCLLLSVVFIYFMKKDLCGILISKDSFLESSCDLKLKDLILKSIKTGSNARDFIEELRIISKTYEEDELNEVVVPVNNNFIPEFLKYITRDSILYNFNEIHPKQISIKQNIGQGHFSIVHKASYKISEKQTIFVAAKQLKSTEVDLSLIKKELRPSMMGSHRNMLKSYGFTITDKGILLISELGDSNLLTYLRNSSSILNDKIRRDFCIQICEGMHFLSDEKRFIHRDLAARNILVFNSKEIEDIILKISDFGLTVSLKEDKNYYKSSQSGHRCWLPFADVKNAKYSTKSDIYSFGILMWEIFTNGLDVPTYKKDGNHIRDLPKKVHDAREHCIEIPDWAYDIMRACWSKHENDRPDDFSTIKSLLNEAVPNRESLGSILLQCNGCSSAQSS